MVHVRKTSRIASAAGALALTFGLMGVPAFAAPADGEETATTQVAAEQVEPLSGTTETAQEDAQVGAAETSSLEDTPQPGVQSETEFATEDSGQEDPEVTEPSAITPLAEEGGALSVADARAVAHGEAASTVDINLMNINDFHGAIRGDLNEARDALTGSETVRFAGTIEELRAQFPADASLFLSNGDNVGASLFASAIQNDEPTIELMNALGLAATSAGNHEFDQGWEDLQFRIRDLLNAPVLGANVYEKGTETPVLQEYAMLEASGLKVAVIGAITEETPTLVTPTHVADLDFGDPVDAVNRVVADLNALPADERPDIIVAEYHEGAPEDQAAGVTLEGQIAASPVFAKIVNETSPEVDVIFNGHTHRTYVWDAPIPGGEDRTRPVVQAGYSGAGIGQVVLTVDPADGSVVSYTGQFVPVTDKSMEELLATYPDPLAEVYDIVLAAEQHAFEEGSVVVGDLSAPITRAYTEMELVDGVYQRTDDSTEDRGGASPLGTLVGNALVASLADLPDAPQIGVVNPGGMRTDLIPNADGEITMAQARAVLPFNNDLAIVSMTGDQIITMLEQQWQRTDTGDIPGRPYLQLGLSDNVQYTYSVIEDPDHEGASIGVVTSVTIDGVPIDPDAMYRISTFSFLAAGGDNFHVFQDASVTLTGRLDWEGWVAYLRTSLEGEPFAPDFSRAGVELEGLASGTITAGEEVTVSMSNADMFAVGAPANTEATGSLVPMPKARALPESIDVATSEVTDGATEMTFVVPPTIVGESTFQAVFDPTGTEVRYPVTVESAADTVPVNLLNINDFHGRIQGVLNEAGDALTSSETVQFAGTIEMLRDFFPADASLFLSNGDNVGASLYASAILDDQPTIEVMNALGLAATSAGNHEFDKGWEDLQIRIQEALDAPVLGANVYAKGTQTPVLQEYAMLEASGLRVAVIGAITEETPTLVTPTHVADLDFGDPVDAVNRVVAQLNALPEGESPDIIVAEYHEGATEDQAAGVTLEGQIAASPVFAKIVNETSPEVDVIFNGHTHRTYVWDAPVPGDETRTRPVVQAGSYGQGIGQVVLTVDPADGSVVSYTGQFVPVTDKSMEELLATYPDPLAEVYDIVLAAEQNAREEGSVVVGELTAPITRAYTEMELVDGRYQRTEGSAEDRGEASSLGTLIGNALVASLADLPDAPQIGVVNPGGMRTDLIPNADGEITMAQARAVLPFNNELSVVTMTGEQVITMLEQQWQRTDTGDIPGRPYLQLGLSDNVQYTYSVVEDPDHEGAPIGVITSVTIDGVPIDPAGEYKIGTFAFLSAGGDNFHVFQDASVTQTGRLDWEGWVAYLRTSLEGEPFAPDFARQGVELEGLGSGELTAGEEVTVTMSRTDVFSVGSPANTSATISLLGPDGAVTEIGTSPVVDGSTTVTFVVPEGMESAVFAANFDPTGTEVRYPVSITPGDGGNGGGPDPTPEPKPEPGPEPTPEPGPGAKPGAKPGEKLPTTGASVLAALLIAGLLGGTGVAMKVRRPTGVNKG